MHPDTGRQLEHVQQKAVEDLDRIADAVARLAPNGANHGRFLASSNPTRRRVAHHALPPSDDRWSTMSTQK